MRRVRYETYARYSSKGRDKVGTVLDLLEDIPYLLMSRLLPPLAVVNSILRTGLADAGMSGGCRWRPFRLTQAEYRTLVLHAGTRYEVPTVPRWVRTRPDWTIWTLKRLHGVPVGPHRALERRYRRIERVLDRALARNDNTRVLALHAQAVTAGQPLSDFLWHHLRGGRTP